MPYQIILRTIFCTFAIFLLLALFNTGDIFAGGHEDTGELEYTVDTSNLSGISLFLGNLYNDQRLWFAVVATLSMAILGAVIAIFTEYVLKVIGLNVTKTGHRR